jgi:ribosomal RNA-processing protein 8
MDLEKEIPSTPKKKNIKNTLKKIYSFDIVSTKPHIKNCDIANLPLEKKSIDIAIFCLALMGTNYLDFLWEATRCLKKGGYLIVAEVLSRITNLKAFNAMICELGYEVITEV